MWKDVWSLMKKDFRLMVSSRFFWLAAGSLILYSCYINLVYVNMDQDIFPVYIYGSDSSVDSPDSSAVRVGSLEELRSRCGDGYAAGIDASGGGSEITMVSSGIDSLDNCRAAYAALQYRAVASAESFSQYRQGAEIIGTNDKEMKNRREMTAECLFFELAAVGFLGLAAMLFQEKQMGAVRVHAILPVGKNLFILSKLVLILLSDLAFTFLLTVCNLGVTKGLEVLPSVMLNAGVLSLIMALVGFICAIVLPDFKQFSLLYLVLAVFITTPVFLVGQTGISPGWIRYHPMYYMFLAMKNSYFTNSLMNAVYYISCTGTIMLLFAAARRGLAHEMAKEG